MDPISVLALVGTCTSITGTLVSAIRALDEIVSKARTSDRPASRLAAQLRLFNATVGQLKQWLNRATVISPGLRSTMQTALRACEDVISDIESHVTNVAPKRGNGQMGLGLVSKVRNRWDEKIIQDYERMLGTQFQTFDLFTRLLSLNNRTDQESVLESATNRDLLQQSVRDARTVRENTVSSVSYAENSGNTDRELDADMDIVTSGPYLEQYRKMMKQARNSKVAIVETRETTSGSSTTQTSSTRSHGKRRFLSGLFQPLTGEELRNAADSRLIFAQLCEAARDGHSEWASHLLEEGADVNGVDERSLTPLYHAVCSGHLPVVQLLVDRGADINGKSGRSSALLSTAVQKNNVEVVRYLLENGAEVNAACCNGTRFKSPLFLAIEEGKIEACKELIARGANLDEGERHGLNALCCAVDKEYRQIVKLLLGNGANVNAAGSKADWGTGLTALHVAAYRGEENILQDLLEAGADISLTCQRKNVTGVTALHLARGKCASRLIENGGKIFARDSSGQFPLSSAVRFGDLESVRANLLHNAPVNARDHKKLTPLYFACKAFAGLANGLSDSCDIYVEITRELLDAGANTEAKRACRAMLMEDCKKFLTRAKASRGDVLDLMKVISDEVGRRVLEASESPSGVRDMPRGPIGESFLAVVVTRPMQTHQRAGS